MRNRYSLVNVNNNNITIVFLKMILSFSDVILANLSLPRPSLHSTNISWYTIQFSRVDEIERWKVSRWLLRTKSKVLNGIGWEFFRNFAWFGSFIHGEKESEVCLAFDSKDINLISWIKMRLVKMFFFVFSLVQEALFIEFSMVFFILGGLFPCTKCLWTGCDFADLTLLFTLLSLTTHFLIFYSSVCDALTKKKFSSRRKKEARVKKKTLQKLSLKNLSLKSSTRNFSLIKLWLRYKHPHRK